MRGRFSVVVAALLALALVVTCAAALLRRDPVTAPPAPPAEGAGSATVTLSRDAAGSDQGENVRALLQRHYDAINARDYAAWGDTVVSERAERLTREAWTAAYRTTVDGSMHVDRIDVGPPGADGRTTLLVMVRFVSTQDPALAPPQAQSSRLCWHSTLPLTGSPWRIGLTGDGSSAPEAC